MSGRRFIDVGLTNAETRQTVFLTLAFFFLLAPHLSLADPPPPVEAEEANQAKLRANEAMNYIRKQGLQGVSLLPNEARTVIGWFSGNWHPVHISDDDDGGAPTTQNRPLAENSPADGFSSATMAANFHHKGFLPTHDAIMIGATFKGSAIDNKLQFAARPFIGQSWHSLRNYWGGEVSMDIAQRPDGLPWGKISMGYVGGEESLTDHGRGIDLHGDVDLTNGFKFTSGLRQNSASGDANYLMLKWKLDFQ